MNGEGFDPVGISNLIEKLFGQKGVQGKSKNRSITLGHLEKAIKAGRLDEEIVNGD